MDPFYNEPVTDQQIVPPPVPPEDNHRTSFIGKFVQWFKHLPKNQKLSFAALALIALSVPASLAATLNEVRSRSKAAYLPISAPVTPPTNPTPIPTAIMPCDSNYQCPVNYGCVLRQDPSGNWYRMCLPGATPAPYLGCYGPCSLDKECGPGLVCQNKRCVKAACPGDNSCRCMSPTPYPTSTPRPTPYPTSTPRPTLKPTPRPTPLLSCSATRSCPPGLTCVFDPYSKTRTGYCRPLPSPTPAPLVNSNPIITTASLPTAYTGKSYSAVIEGYDRDLSDALRITATGLPAGLSVTNCRQAATRMMNSISCQLTGKVNSYQWSTYNVTLTITDSRGGVSRKQLSLSVRPLSVKWPPIIIRPPTNY